MRSFGIKLVVKEPEAFLMEKIFAVFFIIFASLGCQSEKGELLFNDSNNGPTDTTNDDLNEPTAPTVPNSNLPAPQEVTIKASRDYQPSIWNHGSYIMLTTSIYNIPEEIEILSGNSGTGWLSLYASGRKFCYQGNASNNKTPDGDLFVLVKEKTDLNEECYSNNSNTTYDTEVYLEKDFVIDLEVNGGGCSVGKGACLFTEVSATITPIK
jgi:hypothetical protein